MCTKAVDFYDVCVCVVRVSECVCVVSVCVVRVSVSECVLCCEFVSVL